MKIAFMRFRLFQKIVDERTVADLHAPAHKRYNSDILVEADKIEIRGCFAVLYVKLYFGRNMEIDEKFCSLSDWQRWAECNPFIFAKEQVDIAAARIIANGFLEPLTGRIVAPQDIDRRTDNLREGIAAHGLNSRCRSVLWIIEEKLRGRYPHEPLIFGAEALTPLALIMRGIYHRFLGSEYGSTAEARQALYPIQHEDLTALTLPSERFDLVTTNEVLEHVPDLDRALSEIARVLKPGGWHVGTHPFMFMSNHGQLRSRIEDGRIIHLMEPEYHGNPVDPDGGSLVFETPGWDIIDRAKDAGFTEVHMRFVMSEKHGFMTENYGVFVLCAQR